MIAIVGKGNVAMHLFNALKAHCEVCLVDSRTLKDYPDNPEITLLAVSDKAIKEVSERLPHNDGIVAHIAGSVPLENIDPRFKHRGVFYPLQTFTKGVIMDYREIPVFIEATDESTLQKLEKLAGLISGKVRKADSEQRKKLHLASVFACNFVNSLAGISEEIMASSGIDFRDLLPLMRQTVNKLESKSPGEAQTGPAVRGDMEVIESHLRMLEGNEELKEIYKIFTKKIINDTKENIIRE